MKKDRYRMEKDGERVFERDKKIAVLTLAS